MKRINLIIIYLNVILGLKIINTVKNERVNTFVTGLNNKDNINIRNKVIINGKEYVYRYPYYYPYDPYINDAYTYNNPYVTNGNPLNIANTNTPSIADNNPPLKDLSLNTNSLPSEKEDISLVQTKKSVIKELDEALNYTLMLELVNKVRFKKGSRPLKYHPILIKTAKQHSNDQARHRHMSHEGSDGSTAADRLNRNGFKWRAVGENVACNQKNVNQVMIDWIKSPGHFENLINDAYTLFGAACTDLYWTQLFAKEA